MSLDARLVERLYRRACAEKWRVPVEQFAEALERAAARGANLDSLHLDDLALACGCTAGDEAAWEYFIREQRPILYRAADALDPTGGARDLADGIYGELFERSLFRYFHGRSSLATWLRAVLAQRHVDRFRAHRRIEPLNDDKPAARPGDKPASGLQQPDRGRYVDAMEIALRRAAGALAPRDRLRLNCYYAQELTLAETGKLLGEHEATCSRRLARTRKTLRQEIERHLHAEGLSQAAIDECVASIGDDAGPLDLKRLLDPEARKESPADRSTVRGPL